MQDTNPSDRKAIRRPRTLTKTVAAIRNATIARHHQPSAVASIASELVDLTGEEEEEEPAEAEVIDGTAGGKDMIFLSKDGKPVRVEDVDTPLGRCQKTTWAGVMLGGREYRAGDAALIRLKGEKRGRGLITSIFELKPCSGRKEYKIHVHWLRESVVGQKGELFLKDRCCQDIHLRHVIEKLSFSLLSKPLGTSSLYCRFVYEPHRLTWRDPDFSDPSRCDSCKQRRKAEETRLVYREADGFRYQGEVYHLDDCVHIDSGASGQLLIGRIQILPRVRGEIHPAKDTILSVSLFQRASDRPQAGFVDSYELVATKERREVSLDSIRGRCIVGEDQAAADRLGEMAFYCNKRVVHDCVEQYQLPTCRLCLDSQARQAAQMKSFLDSGRLPAMDLYSGAGGTVTGASRYFSVKAAVDFDPVSCETLRRNHPQTEVYCSSVNRLHLRELRKLSNKLIQPQWDGEGRIVPMLPKHGSIALLTACPPCQGHSGANHHRSADDERNDELFTCLSELDRLQADFFLFENVPGIKNERDDGSFVDTDSTKSFAQLAITVLLAIGYQCRLSILDCRSYGSPQHRVRCFILAAKQGVKLPEFPPPTHSNPRPPSTTFGLDECASQAFCIELGRPGTGPLPAVTAEDAISDVPAFQFAEALPTGQSRDQIGPLLPSARGHADARGAIGFVQPAPYRLAPLNTFQKKKRGPQAFVTDHFTPYATISVIDIIRAAYAPGAESLRGTRRCADPAKGFNTLLTESRPGGKATGQVHWDWRTFTVAERKRAQGLPDSYVLCGHVSEVDRQLGNMVNVDIAEAIYANIVRQAILPWYRKRGTGEVDQMARWRADDPISPFHTQGGSHA